MVFERIVIENYKCFRYIDLPLANPMTILAGDNESGKSTLLEAVNLCLTQQLSGRNALLELSPYLFNKDCVTEFLKKLQSGEKAAPPAIRIELFFSDSPEFASLRGTNNSKRLDQPGVQLLVEFDEDFTQEYSSYIQNPAKISAIPTEYYTIRWYSFAFNPITKRSLPISVTFIDTTTIRLQYGSDYFIQRIIDEALDAKERAGLSLAYRMLKEEFAKEDALAKINARLGTQGGKVSDKDMQVSIDISRRASWEGNLTPYLDDIPFQNVGKGDQSTLKMLIALEQKAEAAHVILIEEPENHLSYSRMNELIARIQAKCENKQLLVATHSTFVLNKLGIGKLVLMTRDRRTAALSSLSSDTQEYFQKLPGFDTLRLVVARVPVLVEGPSDELIVQKAYFQKNGKLPIEDGIDIIAVRGLSFRRFIEIAVLLKRKVVVVTDNDGNHKKHIEEKYSEYLADPNVKLCYDTDDKLSTLELQILAVNSLDEMNKALSRKDSNKEDLATYMISNKTECAFKLFQYERHITMPSYILDALNG